MVIQLSAQPLNTDYDSHHIKIMVHIIIYSILSIIGHLFWCTHNFQEMNEAENKVLNW